MQRICPRVQKRSEGTCQILSCHQTSSCCCSGHADTLKMVCTGRLAIMLNGSASLQCCYKSHGDTMHAHLLQPLSCIWAQPKKLVRSHSGMSKEILSTMRWCRPRISSLCVPCSGSSYKKKPDFQRGAYMDRQSVSMKALDKPRWLIRCVCGLEVQYWKLSNHFRAALMVRPIFNTEEG